MKIDSLNTLLQEELKDIYDFEKRLVKAIPKMARAASSEELRSALADHLEVTRNQVQRVEHIFQLLGTTAKAKACVGMKGIIEEGEETLQLEAETSLLDTAIIGAAQRVEHYEMAAYAAAHAMAEQLGNQEIADLLQETLEEERDADDKLTEIAEQLLAGMGSGESGETNRHSAAKGRMAGGSASDD